MAKDLGQVDPSVRVPAAVRAAAARADEIYRTSYPSDIHADPQNDPAGSRAPETPAAEDTGNSQTLEGSGEDGNSEGTENTNQETSSENNQDNQQGELPLEAPRREARAPQGEETKDTPVEEWVHRYNSMKGRYERAENTVRQLTERLTGLESVIATLQTRGPDPDTSDSKPAGQRKKLVTEDEIETYGSDYIDFARRLAKEEVSEELDTLRSQVEILSSRLNGVNGYVETSVKDKMFTTLDAKVPDWKQINTDPNFIAWLELPDAYSGAIRLDMLRSAFERNDTPRVLAFFNGFLAEEAAVAPAGTRSDTGNYDEPQPRSTTNSNEVTNGSRTNGARRPTIPLESLAAPGRARPAAGSNPPVEKPVITRASIAKFYADVASGKYRGREADKNKAEKNIFDAEREGRIR